MDAAAWVMANKVKTGLGLIAALAAVVVLPISFVAWAEDLAEQKAREAELRMQGREEVIHSTQAATHNYDFYAVRAAQAEQELIELEKEKDEGVQLTASQERKMKRLERQIDEFNKEADDALQQLKKLEHEDHGETE